MFPAPSPFPTVVVSVAPAAPRASVRITGDIDMAAEPALSEAANRLYGIAPRTVVVDLGGVTFAGSTLISFLVRLHTMLPADAALVLWRPAPMTRRVLDMTALPRVARVRDEPSLPVG